jgi:hypothetical protein
MYYYVEIIPHLPSKLDTWLRLTRYTLRVMHTLHKCDISGKI